MKRTKISNEEFLSRMKGINENIEFLEEFPGTAYRIKCRCKVCGNEWSPISGALLRGDGCKICGNRNRRITLEDFKERLAGIGNDVQIIGEYTSANERVDVRCNVCGNEWSPLARKLLEGHGCPKCAKRKMRLSHEEFIKRVSNALTNISVIGEYTGIKERISARCNICEYEWSPFAFDLQDGKGCPSCAGNKRLTNEEFIERLTIANQGIIPIDPYTSTYTKIRFQCRSCGHIWSAVPKTAMKGHGCPICNKGILWTNDEFLEHLKDVNNDIIPLDEYINSQTRIRFQCKDGHIWNAFPNNIIRGHGCPICKTSRGERRIASYLINNNIKYVHGKEYDDLFGVGNGHLSYDFYLPGYNLLIEYQGEQHEFPVDFVGDGNQDENFERQQEHDRRKREYAKSHNIDLLEIWYTDYENIETILVEYLGNKLAA